MRAIVVFSKAPEAGRVKTRLTSHMSAIDAALYHEAFVLDTLDCLLEIKNIDRFIACHPDKNHSFFREIEKNLPVVAFNQEGENLGERMKNALYDLRAKGYKEIVIIGSDSPTIPRHIVENAFDNLKENELVIGPSIDGGYYLIGISGKVPDLFNGIGWGSDSVFEETLKKTDQARLKPSILTFWYDIDTIKELRFMALHLDALGEGTCSRTREMIKKLKQIDYQAIVRGQV